MVKYLIAVSGLILALGHTGAVLASETGSIKLYNRLGDDTLLVGGTTVKAKCIGGKDEGEHKNIPQNHYLHCDNAVAIEADCNRKRCKEKRRFDFAKRAGHHRCSPDSPHQTFYIKAYLYGMDKEGHINAKWRMWCN